MTLETSGLELTLSITLVLQANRLTKCASLTPWRHLWMAPTETTIFIVETRDFTKRKLYYSLKLKTEVTDSATASFTAFHCKGQKL